MSAAKTGTYRKASLLPGQSSIAHNASTRGGGGFDAAGMVALVDRLVETMDHAKITPTTHVEAFLKENRITDENEATFLREVFYGTEREKRSLKILVNGLFTMYSGKMVRTDYNVYLVFCYLIVFRLEEMGFLQIRRFIKSQDSVKMELLLSFLFGDNLDDWLPSQLSVIFDYLYVEEVIVRPLRDHRNSMMELRETLQGQISADAAKKEEGPKKMKKTFKATVPVPFNLTQPLPRPIPSPPYKMKPEPEKTRKIPKSNKTLMDIEEEKLRRRKEIRKKIVQNNAKYAAPLLHTSDNKKFKKAVEENEKRILQSVETDHHPRPAPVVREEDAPIRMNTTAILREDALFRKKQREEAKMIREFETCLHDTQEFDEWKEREFDIEEEWQRQFRAERKLELQRSAKIAKKAVEESVAEKRDFVQNQRAEMLELEAMKKEEAEALVKHNQQRVRDVQESYDKAGIARAEVEAQNRESAAEVYAAREIFKEIAERERELELEHKRLLIREIQAMEAVASIRKKEPTVFDPTTASGVGLLCEISLVELQERVQFLQQEEALDVENKRQNIIRRKQDKVEMIMAKAANISKLRKLKKETGDTIRKQNHAAERARRRDKREYSDDQTLKLEKRLLQKAGDKKTEALALAQEIAETKRILAMASASKPELEAKKWRGIRNAAERAGKKEQAEAKIVNIKKAALLDRAERIRTMNTKAKLREKTGLYQEMDKTNTRLATHSTRVKQTFKNMRKSQAGTIRNEYKRILKKRDVDRTWKVSKPGEVRKGH